MHIYLDSANIFRENGLLEVVLHFASANLNPFPKELTEMTIEIRANLNHGLELKEERVSVASGMLRVYSAGRAIFKIRVKEIDLAFIEEGLGIAKLVIKDRSGKEHEAAYFTKEKVKNFKKFADALNQYASKKRMPKATFEERKELHIGMRTIFWLYGFVRRYIKLIAIGVILSLILVFVNLIPPYLLKVLIDNVILSSTHSRALFIELVAVLIGSYIASTVVGAIQNYVFSFAGNEIVSGLRSELFKRSIRLPATDIDNITVSRIQSRLITDTGNTQWLLTYGISTVIVNSLTIIGIGVILFLIFPKLALWVLLPLPFILVLIILYNGEADRAYHRVWRRSADLITKINDAIPNHAIVKSATKEDFEGAQFDRGLNDYYQSNIASVKMELKYWQPVGFMFGLAAVVIWWIGGNLVIAGTLQLGVITAFIAYMGMFYSPIQQLSSWMPYIQEAMTSGERLREVFDNAAIHDWKKGKMKPKLDMGITLNKVWFGYDPLFPILKGVDMNIRKGRITAIVGKSGSGKSTMAKLILGLYRPNSGSIKFGNVDMKEIDMKYMRERISYVPQDASFFENTIVYNMSYFSREHIEPKEILASAKAVEMHNEIMKLPLCYDYRIKGGGMSLSGGQRQRLAVARALLGNPDIVVFDEITSNLDAINSRKVNRSVMKLETGKTMVTITHDLSEIMESDHAIVMEDGKVVEEGKPMELIKRRGKFYGMFKYRLIGRKEQDTRKRKKLDDFIDGYVAEHGELKVIGGERRSLVNVTRNGKEHKGLLPRMPFPISNPGFVIFYGHDRDMFAIDDYKRIDAKSAAALANAINASSFSPKVVGVEGIRITGDGILWKLNTEKGSLKVITKNRRDIIPTQDSVILIDEFNSPIQINYKDLDKASLRLVENSV